MTRFVLQVSPGTIFEHLIGGFDTTGKAFDYSLDRFGDALKCHILHRSDDGSLHTLEGDRVHPVTAAKADFHRGRLEGYGIDPFIAYTDQDSKLTRVRAPELAEISTNIRDAARRMAAFADHLERQSQDATHDCASPQRTLREPRVAATIHPKPSSGANEDSQPCSFDATQWFINASDQDLITLQARGWRSTQLNDQVAYASSDQDVLGMLGMLRAPNWESVFEFHSQVNPPQALAWIKEHRNHLWGKMLCAQYGVPLSNWRASPDTGSQSWSWSDPSGQLVCERRFATEAQAAVDAVKVMRLDTLHTLEPTDYASPYDGGRTGHVVWRVPYLAGDLSIREMEVEAATIQDASRVDKSGIARLLGIPYYAREIEPLPDCDEDDSQGPTP